MRFVLLGSVFLNAGVDASASGSCSPSEHSIWRNNQSFTDVFTQCSVNSMGIAPNVITCMANRISGLSGTCLTCFGQAAECGRDRCAGQCAADPGSPQCLTCIDNNCSPRLLSCTGVASNADLPLPPLPRAAGGQGRAPRRRGATTTTTTTSTAPIATTTTATVSATTTTSVSPSTPTGSSSYSPTPANSTPANSTPTPSGVASSTPPASSTTVKPDTSSQTVGTETVVSSTTTSSTRETTPASTTSTSTTLRSSISSQEPTVSPGRFVVDTGSKSEPVPGDIQTSTTTTTKGVEGVSGQAAAVAVVGILLIAK